jgi:phosphoribosyl-ATP pyrophosphohydrolase/phosphoribosyl-AMP cyclohydrolase
MSDREEKKIDFSKGLIPTVVVDRADGKILMLAFSSEESLKLTFEKKLAHFFSRERKRIWMKGEESGNTMRVHKIISDCDLDSLIFVVEPKGPACHTQKKSCFFYRIEDDGKIVEDESEPTYGILYEIEKVVNQRKRDIREGQKLEGSYTAELISGGIPKIISKIMEEAGELCESALKGKKGDVGEKNSVIWESADLIFHIIVLLSALDIPLEKVMKELLSRRK